jgi:hypothetical protein
MTSHLNPLDLVARSTQFEDRLTFLSELIVLRREMLVISSVQEGTGGYSGTGGYWGYSGTGGYWKVKRHRRVLEGTAAQEGTATQRHRRVLEGTAAHEGTAAQWQRQNMHTEF